MSDHTPRTAKKSTDNFGRPASTNSDFYIRTLFDKVRSLILMFVFVSLYVLYEIMWNTCVTLIYFFILYICTSRSLLQCCTSKCNVVQCRAELLVV